MKGFRLEMILLSRASCREDTIELGLAGLTSRMVIELRASFSDRMGDIMMGRKGVDDMSSLLTLAGVYRDGKVEFIERPAGVGEDVPVLVTFLPANGRGESEPSADAVEEVRRAVRERFMVRLKQGIPFGGPPYAKARNFMTDSIAQTRILVDTNILIYAADRQAGDKNLKAVELVDELTAQNRMVVSVQVLNEFYHAATCPNKLPSLSHDDAYRTIRDLADAVPVLPLNSAITLRALDAIPRHGFSFWDALIWAAAKENGIRLVYTEDFQHGRDVEGVRIVNPFAES